MFNAAEFHIPAEKPQLLPISCRLGDGGQIDQFVKVFGSRWKKTPKKGVWFIGTPGIQFTMVLSKDYGMDFAFQNYDTVEEFKQAFEKGHTASNAVYFRLHERQAKWQNHPVGRIIEFLQSREISLPIT